MFFTMWFKRYDMSLELKKTVFVVSDQVRHKPCCTASEDGQSLEILDLGSRGMAETKALISCAVTAQLVCVSVFAYAKSRFSHNEAHINQSRTNGPINAHLTIVQVMPKYNHNNEKQEALL